MNKDDVFLKYCYKQGFVISAQDNSETLLDRNNSKITIKVRR